MKLEDWLELARLGPEEPLPPELRAALAAAASRVEWFALSRRVKPDRAAMDMAKMATGLTAGAIEAFRKQQDALAVAAVIEFNRHQPSHAKIEMMEEELASRFGVSTRQIRRWRQQVMKKDI